MSSIIKKSAIPGSNFSKVIFVDADNGSDIPLIIRGQTGLPYKTLEAARDASSPIITSVSGLTITTGSLTISGFADTSSLYVGQKLYGDGLYPGTSIKTIAANSITITIAAYETITSTAIVTFYESFLIYVMPGNYTVTTTDTNGLAKEGVDWYFSPATYVNKSTAGALFYLPDMNIEFNILGYGNFTTMNSAGSVFVLHTSVVNKSLPKIVLQGDSVTSSVGTCIYVASQSLTSTNVKIEFNTIQSSASYAIHLYYCQVTINAQFIYSTANTAIMLAFGVTLNITADEINSSASYGVWDNDYDYVFANVRYIYGASYGYGFRYQGSLVGSVNQLYKLNAQGNINVDIKGTIVGAIISLPHSVSWGIKCTAFYLTDTYTLVVSNGYIVADYLYGYNAYSSSFNLTGGVIKIETARGYRMQIYNNGSTLIFNDIFDQSDYTDYVVICNSGKTTVNGVITTESPTGSAKYTIVKLDGGTFVLNGRLQYVINTAPNSGYYCNGVLWNGGNLVLNGAVMTRPTPYLAATPANFITVPATGTNTNLTILAGGLSVNGNSGEILNGRKWKAKFSITAADLTTNITLDSVIFNVNNPAVPRTKAELASDLVTIININSSSTTASQDTPSTDEYLYVEGDTIGDAIAVSTLVNCTALYLQSESKALTNITGGQLIESTYVL